MGDSLRTLKGVGDKTEKLFFKLGIYDTDDLLQYYPRNYDAFEAPVDIADLEEGTVKAVSAAVCSGVYVTSAKGRQIITASINDSSGKLSVIWFNMPYLRTVLKRGSQFVFRGRIVRKQSHLEMEHPEVFTPAAYGEILHSLQPVYGLTGGLSNKTVTKMIHQLLKNLPMYSEFLPEEIRERYQLADINYALRTIHFPGNMEELLLSRKRLVFDEFLLFILSIQMMKEKNEETPNYFPIQKTWVTEQIIENLPYSLTNAQLNTWHEIERDMSGQALMSRLIQGDVGSGKTVVACIMLLAAIENGYQAAIMAPTEILAQQHYNNLVKWLTPLGLSVELLIGSISKKQRTVSETNLRNGQANIAVGTHALIQDTVDFANLGAVVIDEQHRFGVKQRLALRKKSQNPQILTMTATPIPRTLAITMNGDLDLTIIDELPSGRKPILTTMTNSRRQIASLIRREVESGRQAYIVYPLIEESETLSAKAATIEKEKWQNEVFPEYKIGLLHGKLKNDEKDEVMNKFKNKEYDILVSTTVVEVGVDVPNATVIVIENAERFGLSQLHQLRGRVGRSDLQSYCVLSSSTKSQETRARLDIMTQTNDGFVIAEKDLQLRGPGEFLGTRQSGLPDMIIADIVNDAKILELARAEAIDFVKNNNIDDYPLLNEAQGLNFDGDLFGAG